MFNAMGDNGVPGSDTYLPSCTMRYAHSWGKIGCGIGYGKR